MVKVRYSYLKISVFLVLLILSSSLVLASTQIKLEPVKNDITLIEEALYNLEIKNTGEITANYKIFSLELGWIVDPKAADRSFFLNPGETKKTTIKIKPTEDFKPGIYAPTLYVDETIGKSHKSYNHPLKIYINPDGPVDYVPSIKVELDMPEKINPRESVSVKMFLENRNPLDLKDLKIRIHSEMSEFIKEGAVDLPPLQKKTAEFLITPNKYQQPKSYTIFFIFERFGEQVKVIPKNIEILPLLPDFEVSKNDETIFFKRFSAVSLTNPGNVKNTQDVNLPVGFWESLFVTDASTGKDDGQRVVTWKVTLEPGEVKYVFYVTNYRVLFYLLAILMIFGIFYLVVKSPIEVTKKATAKHGEDHETLSEIKITIEVRNKSNKKITGVEIIDVVPSIANVEKSLQLGTLKPKEIRNSRKGTKVIWSLAELDAHEHRLITYKIKAKLNILGTFSLPRATLEYKKGKKKGKVFSNVFRLSA